LSLEADTTPAISVGTIKDYAAPWMKPKLMRHGRIIADMQVDPAAPRFIRQPPEAIDIQWPDGSTTTIEGFAVSESENIEGRRLLVRTVTIEHTGAVVIPTSLRVPEDVPVIIAAYDGDDSRILRGRVGGTVAEWIWTYPTDPAVEAHTSVAYNGRNFVIVSHFGAQSLYSVDGGATWLTGDLPSGGNYTVCYGNAEFVAIDGNGLVYTSTTGASWTSQGNVGAYYVRRVAYGAGVYALTAAQKNYPFKYGIMYGTPLGGWNWVDVGTAKDEYWLTVAYGMGTFVAMAQSGLYTAQSIMTSTDGMAWMWRSLLNRGWRGLCCGATRFVAVGSTRWGYSDDGINWTVYDPPGAAQRVGFRSGWYIAAGTEYLALSIDGINWTPVTVSANEWKSISGGG
jgi:hypothetical protein